MNMRSFYKIIIFMVLFPLFHANADNMTFAGPSRGILSGLLYDEGIRSENGGYPGGALRDYFYAHQIDSGNREAVRRYEDVLGVIKRGMNEKYRAALYDIQYGRKGRACALLREALSLSDEVDFDEKIKITDLFKKTPGLCDSDHIINTANPGFARNSSLNEDESWQKLRLIQEIEGLISRKDFEGARILLDQVGEKYSEDEEIKRLHEKLKNIFH